MRFSTDGAALRRAVDVIGDALIVVAALVGAVLALGHSLAAVGWVLVSLAGLTGQLIWTWSQQQGTWSPMGRAIVLRSATAVSTAVCMMITREGVAHALGAAFAGSVLVGSIVMEPFVARAARFKVPLAVRLPGLPTTRERRDLGWAAVICSIGSTAVGLLVAVVGGSAWLWAAVAVVAVVPVLIAAIDGRAKVLFARRLRTQLPEAVARYEPDFVVYTSRPDDASYQIMMWLPYLQRAGLRFMIIARNHVPAVALAGLTDVPVVEARGIADLDSLVVPSLKAAFYVNASSGNGALVRFQHLTHIYLGHGDSDKPPSYNPTHAMYDQIFAAGPAAARRYAAHGVSIPAEKFRIVGRPQVEDVVQVCAPIRSIATPTVLYAPTWRGHVEETMLYSLLSGERIVSALLERGSTVIFRPHPFSYAFGDDANTIARIKALLEADARRTGRKHLWGPAAESERGIFDCINASDAMITDVSSVVSDYLFSQKPFAMIAVPSEPEAFVAEFPVARASYVVRGDLADLDERLDQMLGADPLAPERARIRIDYLGDFPAEGYASAFVEAVGHVTGKSMEDMSEDREDRDEDNGAGEKPEDESSTDEDSDSGRAAGPSWSRYVRLATRAGLDLLGTVFALAAFAVALADGPPGLATVLAVLSIWATFQSVASSVIRPGRWSRLITEGDATRCVLAFALLVLGYRRGEALEHAVAVGVILAVIAVERRIRSAWGGGMLVRNLPAALKKINQIVPRGLLPLISGLVIIIGFVAVWTDWPAIVVLVLATLFGLIAAEIIVRALWRAREVERAELRLRPALEAHAPDFAVYFASTVGAHYQIGMWLPYFLRIGRPFIIITRTAPMLRQIDHLCLELGVEVPLIYRRTLRSVEEVIVDSMTTSFYVNNAARNTHFIERRELTHIWLNHGDSEKPACFNPVHAIYDLIFSAGQAGIDRYARHGVSIPAEKFRIVGRPQVELIRPQRAPIGDLDDQTVLYAPTWQGPFADSRVYSLPVGRQIVEALLARGARVIFRAHPFNYRYADAVVLITEIGSVLDADRAATGREHLWGRAAEQEMSIEDCFNASDAMVSDVSAVVSDYLHSGKPFAIVSVGREPEQLLLDVPAAKAAYVLRENLENLVGVCDDLLGADPLASLRIETKIYYLGDFPDENYAEGFLSAAREVIDAGRTV